MNQLARARIVKCSLEGECLSGKERNTESLTGTRSIQGDSQDGERESAWRDRQLLAANQHLGIMVRMGSVGALIDIQRRTLKVGYRF